MAGYADLESAKVQVRLADDNPDDADNIVLLAAIDEEISRTIELKTGRMWGGTATPSARTVAQHAANPSDLLTLPSPLRSVSSVVITGNWPDTMTLSTIAGDAGNYVLANITREGDAHALKRIDGGAWPYGLRDIRIVVTGVWSDEASGITAPQEIIDAATFVTVETYRQRMSSPTGEIGPDGFMFRPRNPWNFAVVTEAIGKYSNAKPLVLA